MRRQFQVFRYRSKLDPSFSDLDLPFATKLYYSTFTISYTPRFPYQFKMTLISHSRKPKNSDRLAEATRAAMTARTFQFNIRVSSVVVRLCPNVYHTSEYVLDRLQSTWRLEPLPPTSRPNTSTRGSSGFRPICLCSSRFD